MATLRLRIGFGLSALVGARNKFEKVVNAFGRGDTETLRKTPREKILESKSSGCCGSVLTTALLQRAQRERGYGLVRFTQGALETVTFHELIHAAWNLHRLRRMEVECDIADFKTYDRMASPAQIIANQQNAQSSTGPRTPEGKARVSQNAIKHGLTSKHLIIRPDEQEEFDAFFECAVFERGSLRERWRLNSATCSRLAHQFA